MLARRVLSTRFLGAWTCATYARAVASQTEAASAVQTSERRPSHRRFSAFNRTGRSQRVKELIADLKLQDTESAKRSFERLPPRERLDIVRALHNKRRKRRHDRTGSRLPRYRSPTFERYYYFKEEDVEEESTLGRGPGGQATNRRMQTVILKHNPTGLIVKFSRFPSLWLNRRAARELMSLRLEERLLGPASQLGRQRTAREKRKARRQRVVTYLTTKGKKIELRQTERRDVHGFLRNTAPLPPSVSEPLGPALAGKPVFVKSLFDEECQNLWPLLMQAFTHANRTVSPIHTTTAAPAMPQQPPLIFYYMFPVPEQTAATLAEQLQLDLCAQDTVALDAVRQAFRCFAELFGLRIMRRDGSDGTYAVRLARDGMNFIQLRDRLMLHDGSALTPFAAATIPHVHRSLVALGLLTEAQSLPHFAKREVKRAAESSTGDASCMWAKEVLQRLSGPTTV